MWQHIMNEKPFQKLKVILKQEYHFFLLKIVNELYIINCKVKL